MRSRSLSPELDLSWKGYLHEWRSRGLLLSVYSPVSLDRRARQIPGRGGVARAVCPGRYPSRPHAREVHRVCRGRHILTMGDGRSHRATWRAQRSNCGLRSARKRGQQQRLSPSKEAWTRSLPNKHPIQNMLQNSSKHPQKEQNGRQRTQPSKKWKLHAR